MDDYRVYLLDARGHIARAIELQADSPEAVAREIEAQHAPPHGFEIWCGAKRVAVRVVRPNNKG